MAAERGWSTPDGTVYVLDHLLHLAAEFGYSGRRHAVTSAETLCELLRRGHPALVAFDVDIWTGEPIEAGGTAGHIAVVTGYSRRPDGSLHFTATHSQASRRHYDWPAALLLRSMCRMRSTTKPREGDLPAAALPHLHAAPSADGTATRLVLDPSAQLPGEPAAVVERCPGGLLLLSEAGGVRLAPTAELDIR